MFINIKCGECGNINLIFTLNGKCLTHLVVKSMNSFDYENVIRTELLKVALVFSGSDLKVKCRNLDSFSCKKSVHVFIEKLYVNSFKAFEIVISVFVQRRIRSVDKIIVNRNGMRLKAERTKLYGKSVRKACLSG